MERCCTNLAQRTNIQFIMDKQEIIFGLRPVIEAVRFGKELDKILIRKGLSGDLYHELMGIVRASGIPYQIVPVEKLNRITRKNHQGIIAFISLISYSPINEIISQVFESGESPLVLILDGITDVRNFGAIARSAEVAGVHAIMIPERGGAQINSDAVKTSAGALLTLPVCRVSKLAESTAELKNSGLKIIGATEKADKVFYDSEMSGPLAIVLGSEDTGISREMAAICDTLVRIPRHGKIDSLNVSAAAAVLVFEAEKQRFQAG